MIWQDIVLGFGGFVFSIALVPSIISQEKPALGTSLSTAAVLTAFVVTYITLHLWFASLSTALTMIAWYILAVQKYMQLRKQ